VLSAQAGNAQEGSAVIPLRDNIPSKRFPFINYLLIAANCCVFYVESRQLSSHNLETFIKHWAVVPSVLFGNLGGHWKTLITAAFIHGGWMHLIGNMLFLYVFGHSVEDMMGHLRYLVFYILMGMLANGFQAYLFRNSTIPLLGASGAIAGVLGAYFFYYPYARILTLIPFGIFSRIIEIPAFFFLGFWFLMQMLLGSKAQQSMGGVAWWAHASGFLAGLISSPALAIKRRRAR
jgi:membrane associated rhomboid family serine protease